MNRRLLGAGRRAGTKRARVRAIRKFLGWLAVAHELHVHYFVHAHGRVLAGSTLGAVREGSDLAHARCFCVHGGIDWSARTVQLKHFVRID